MNLYMIEIAVIGKNDEAAAPPIPMEFENDEAADRFIEECLAHLPAGQSVAGWRPPTPEELKNYA